MDSFDKGASSLRIAEIDAIEEALDLVTGDRSLQIGSWSADGRFLVYPRNDPTDGEDLWRVSADGSGEPEPFLATPSREFLPALSPDGSLLAYTSDESGRWQVWVRRFPDLGGKTQISPETAHAPLWSRNGRELFYRDLTGRRTYVVDIETEPDLRVSTPRLLFEGPYIFGGFGSPNYEALPDGRFLVVGSPEDAGAQLIHVALSWLEEVERLVPTD